MGRLPKKRLTPAFFERICDVLEEGLSLRATARKLGMTTDTISRWTTEGNAVADSIISKYLPEMVAARKCGLERRAGIKSKIKENAGIEKVGAKWTKVARAQFLADIEGMIPPTVAFAKVGFTTAKAIARVFDLDPELESDTKQAEAAGISKNVGVIKAASEKVWTASAWLLERRYPVEFGKLRSNAVITDGDGKKQPINITIVSSVPRPPVIMQSRLRAVGERRNELMTGSNKAEIENKISVIDSEASSSKD